MNKSTINLLSDPGDWSTWAQRNEIEPHFEAKTEDGRSVLAISSDGNPIACGCWRRPLYHIESGSFAE